MALRRDKILAHSVISHLIPISSFLKKTFRLQLCPFHEDNRPSAKLYKDSDYERLFCYACNRQYTSYSYIKIVLGKEPIKYLFEHVVFEEIFFIFSLLKFKRDKIVKKKRIEKKEYIEIKGKTAKELIYNYNQLLGGKQDE